MVHLLVSWFLSALALWTTARILPGIGVRGFGAALAATVAIAIVNGTVGILLKILAFPLTVITLGLFLFVVNAALLKIASWFVPGFTVRGFLNALAGSILITILNAVFRYAVFS
jgi:putative membrane protein